MLLEDALRYPWDDGDGGTTLVLGGLLTLLAPFVVPALLVLGYALRVVETGLDGGSSPPPLGDWRATFVDGLKAAVVLLAYVVVPFVVGAVLVAAAAGAVGVRLGRVVQDPTTALGLGGVALLGVLLLAALALALLYVAPAALVHLARTGRLRAAFAVDDVRTLVEADAYAASWLLGAVVFATGAVVLALLDRASVGVVLGGFVGFYALVASSWLYARGADEVGFDVEVPATADRTEGTEDVAAA